MLSGGVNAITSTDKDVWTLNADGSTVETVTPDSIQLGAARNYTPAELVQEFYRLYDVVFAASG